MATIIPHKKICEQLGILCRTWYRWRRAGCPLPGPDGDLSAIHAWAAEFRPISTNATPPVASGVRVRSKTHLCRILGISSPYKLDAAGIFPSKKNGAYDVEEVRKALTLYNEQNPEDKCGRLVPTIGHLTGILGVTYGTLASRGINLNSAKTIAGYDLDKAIQVLADHQMNLTRSVFSKVSIGGVVCAAIPLSRGRIAIVDLEDAEKCCNMKWHCHHGYATASGSIKLHRWLIGAGEKQIVDHINGNRLDNRRSNLRIVTSSENAWNSRGRIKILDGDHRPKGISFDKRKHRWQASIQIRRHLGYFESKDEASKAYLEASRKLYGQFAYLCNTTREKLSTNKNSKASQVLKKQRWELFGNRCWMCGGDPDRTDHVIPRSRLELNWPSNLRPICLNCNNRKGAMDWRAAIELVSNGDWNGNHVR